MHTIDPDYLPELAGTVERFLINHHGELDGMLLRGGPQVHFPPHMGSAVELLTKPGDAVRVRGVRPRGVAVVDAVRIENAHGDAVVDQGPPKEKKKHEGEKARRANAPRRHACKVKGVVERLLYGPKGDVHGALLGDGTLVRWPPHEGERLGRSLRMSARIAVRGDALETRFGTVIEARTLGPSKTSMHELHPKSARTP
jgi:hypothetical protein